MSELYSLYTRDLALFSCQYWHKMLREEIAHVFGMGLPHHVGNFTGRSVEIYRGVEDAKNLCDYMVTLPLDHHIFSVAYAEEFLGDAKKLRETLNALMEPGADLVTLVPDSFELFRKMYPGYMLAIFVPGAWADALRAKHGADVEPLIARCFEHRVAMEGLFELWDRALRAGIQAKCGEGVDVRLMTVNELTTWTQTGNLPDQSIRDERAKGYVLVDDEVIVGRPFMDVLRDHGFSYQVPDTSTQEVKGMIAYSAPAIQGKAFVAFQAKDLEAFKEGEVLIAPMTAPDYMFAIHKAAAIVTDEGGITCHAAIVARELQKPTIIGTKIATKVFKTGDLVEVDATKGIVRLIK